MDPAATLRLCGLGKLCAGRDLCQIDSKLQMKMGEGVLDEARHLAPFGSERRMIALKLLPSSLGPGRGRRLQHAAQQALQRPFAQQHSTVFAQRHEGVTATGRPPRLLLAIRQHLSQALGMGLAA